MRSASTRAARALAATLITTFVLSGCGGGGPQNTANPGDSDATSDATSNATATTSSDRTPHAIGEVVHLSHTTIAVLGWAFAAGGGAVGGGPITVDLIIQNDGEDGDAVQPDLSVTGSDGLPHPECSRCTIHGGRGSNADFQQGLRHGERARREFPFEVPSAGPYILHYSPMASSDEAAFFALGSTPIEVAPPAELSTPYPGTVAMGSPATAGDLSLAVLRWQYSTCDSGSTAKPCVIADVAIANKGTTNPSLYVSLGDPTGESFGYVTSNSMLSDYPNTVAPGERVLATLTYSVPTQSPDLVIEVDSSVGPAGYHSSDPRMRPGLFVALGSEPATAALPQGFPGESAPGAVAMSESATPGDAIVTVQSVSYSTGTDYGTPPPGDTFVVVGLQIAAGAREVTAMGTGLITLKDAAGHRYGIDGRAGGTASLAILIPVMPGQPVSGKAGFSVPASGGQLYLVFRYQDQDHAWHSGFVRLTAP